jgi:hypothetical protein
MKIVEVVKMAMQIMKKQVGQVIMLKTIGVLKIIGVLKEILASKITGVHKDIVVNKITVANKDIVVIKNFL